MFERNLKSFPTFYMLDGDIANAAERDYSLKQPANKASDENDFFHEIKSPNS